MARASKWGAEEMVRPSGWEGPMQGGHTPDTHTVPDEVVDGSAIRHDPITAAIYDTNPKRQWGQAKPGMFNVPLVPLLEVGRVMENGAKKYGPVNWRKDPVSMSTYLDAIFRHWALVSEGHDVDTYSQCEHLAHIMACCAIVLDARAHGTLIDDREISQAVSDYLAAHTAGLHPLDAAAK